MKNLIVILAAFFTVMTQAQISKENAIPQISVSGEGKIKVTPDIATITIGVENSGKDAATVKKLNDETIDKVIKYIKKNNIPQSDFQTAQVSLHKSYDYEKKKYNYVANQTLTVTLKDLKKYDEFMMGLTDTGITNINGVEFKSSKLTQYETEARKKAAGVAKQKAIDYTEALGQKVGKVLLITDNSNTYYPQPVFKAMRAEALSDNSPKETLAIGEIEITANVTIIFAVE